MIPLTGITLPFVSYGGSSVVANFVLLAGLLLVSNRANARARVNSADRPARVSSALVLLAALIVGTTYWQTWAAPASPTGRTTRSSASPSSPIKRGLICAADGTVLAANRRKKVGGQTLYFRRYPQGGLASHIVGYSTQSRSRAGLERP